MLFCTRSISQSIIFFIFFLLILSSSNSFCCLSSPQVPPFSMSLYISHFLFPLVISLHFLLHHFLSFQLCYCVCFCPSVCICLVICPHLSLSARCAFSSFQLSSTFSSHYVSSHCFSEFSLFILLITSLSPSFIFLYIRSTLFVPICLSASLGLSLSLSLCISPSLSRCASLYLCPMTNHTCISFLFLSHFSL